MILINEPELDGLQEEDKNQEKVKIVDDENAKIQIQQTNNAGDGENTKWYIWSKLMTNLKLNYQIISKLNFILIIRVFKIMISLIKTK